MHSTIVRAQNVFGFFTTIAFAVAALIAASDYLAVRDPRARIEVGSVNVCVFSLVSFSPPFLPTLLYTSQE
jgi:hypothetical protein